MSIKPVGEYSTLFLDLDGTFYENTNSLWEAIGERINLYLTERMGFAEDKVTEARYEYYTQYGTTLRGLMANTQVEPQDYLAFVHDVPMSNYLAPNEALRAALESLPGTKWIFTNSDEAHVRRVLQALAIPFEMFAGVIDIVRTGYKNKPEEVVYQLALEIAGNPEPASCLMADDQDRNLRPARQLGMYTVLVGPDVDERAADVNIASLQELPLALSGRVK